LHAIGRPGVCAQPGRFPSPIGLRRLRFDEGFCAGLIVEDAVLVKLKSVEKVTKAHH